MNGYNNVGVSDNNATNTANYDGGKSSYSAQALQTDGIKPAGIVKSNGFVFTWPDINSGKPDNYRSGGQTLAVTPVNHAHNLALLGSATNGAASGTATITYTDGSRQTFTLSFSDWASKTHSSSNTVVATLPYRNTSHGQQRLTVYLLSISITLQAGKTVQSVTLPTAVTGGNLHVFAISTR